MTQTLSIASQSGARGDAAVVMAQQRLNLRYSHIILCSSPRIIFLSDAVLDCTGKHSSRKKKNVLTSVHPGRRVVARRTSSIGPKRHALGEVKAMLDGHLVMGSIIKTPAAFMVAFPHPTVLQVV